MAQSTLCRRCKTISIRFSFHVRNEPIFYCVIRRMPFRLSENSIQWTQIAQLLRLMSNKMIFLENEFSP